MAEAVVVGEPLSTVLSASPNVHSGDSAASLGGWALWLSLQTRKLRHREAHSHDVSASGLAQLGFGPRQSGSALTRSTISFQKLGDK